MKKRMLLLLCLLLALPLPARGVEITLLHGWGTMEAVHVAMRQIYQDFETAHPGVTLNQIALPDTEQALAKAADWLAVGEVPDLLFTAGVHAPLIDFMVDKGYALNLAPYLEADAPLRASVSALTLDAWALETGELYTVSDVLVLNGLWLNRTLLAEAGVAAAPRTWDEFFAVCDQITAWAAQAGRDVCPVALNAEDALNLLGFVVAGMDGSAAPSMDSPRLEDALAVVQRIAAYAGTDALAYEYRDTLGLFNAGETVFYVNGIWASGLIDAGVDASFAAFPGTSGTVSGQTALCGYVAGNSGDPERMAASVAFLQYMLSEETQARILTETGQFPSNPGIRVEESAGVSERVLEGARAIREADAQAFAMQLPYSEEQLQRMKTPLRQLLTGALTGAEAAEAIRAIVHPN